MLGTASRTLFVVQADPPAGRVEEFQRWYDEVHGPDALKMGSFTRMCRYRAVGPGQATAPFLALWEGNYADEAQAWGYIRPRAHKLNDSGRVGDIASPRFALMTFLVNASGGPGPRPRALTTVQNDWREAAGAAPAEAWWKKAGLDAAPASIARFLYTSDPAGKGAGYHLAIFEQDCSPAEAAKAWAQVGAPGSSPAPAYRTIFTDPNAPVAEIQDARPRAEAWVMHWEPLTVQP
ncbi:MAG TPA: hypothetical protein VKZ79_15255 [Alphaproteobacteria bacterium]|nr:hypothetical protein [Alphaproteobacteria bacterium]